MKVKLTLIYNGREETAEYDRPYIQEMADANSFAQKEVAKINEANQEDPVLAFRVKLVGRRKS